ncbi:MAG: SDR family oxidoreductase [Spirochaetaceae bacterium]|nr:SDR family oxidoreductase [Spirochaetaceae bacterium]
MNGNKSFVFSEDDLSLDQYADNFYLQTKQRAEAELISAGEKSELNYKIFRVGNLMHNSQSGKFQENIGDNAFYTVVNSYLNLGMIPNVDFEISDFCFVDYTSRGILTLFSTEELNREIFHLVNPNRFSLIEFGKLLKNAGYSVKGIDLADYLDEIYRIYNEDENNRDISNLFLHSAIFKENYFFPGLQYISERTNKILEKENFSWPLLDSDHIKKMVELCR